MEGGWLLGNLMPKIEGGLPEIRKGGDEERLGGSGDLSSKLSIRFQGGEGLLDLGIPDSLFKERNTGKQGRGKKTKSFRLRRETGGSDRVPNKTEKRREVPKREVKYYIWGASCLRKDKLPRRKEDRKEDNVLPCSRAKG